MSEYTSRRKYLAWTEVIVYPCNHSVSLRTERLLIENVYGFSVKGRVFAYDVKGNCGTLEDGVWHAAGCDTYVLIMDTTGNGKFDFLRLGVENPREVPAWVRK